MAEMPFNVHPLMLRVMAEAYDQNVEEMEEEAFWAMASALKVFLTGSGDALSYALQGSSDKAEWQDFQDKLQRYIWYITAPIDPDQPMPPATLREGVKSTDMGV